MEKLYQKGFMMNKLGLALLLLCASAQISYAQEVRSCLGNDLENALIAFKTNLFANESFSSVVDSWTNEVRSDFNAMIDDVWGMFGKIHDYCRAQLKDNPLFEKYKQFTCKRSIVGTVAFSLEDKNVFGDDNKECKSAIMHDVENELEPFYETLTEDEKKEYKEMMHKLCEFFSEICLESEKMLKRYAHFEKELEKSLRETQQVLRIECGLEYPFPSLLYILG